MPRRPRTGPARRRAAASRRGWPALLLACTLGLTGAVVRGGAVGQGPPPAADRQASPAPRSAPAAPARAFLDQHCVACHNDRSKAAGLSLSTADPGRAAGDAELWETVLHKLTTGQMPPAGRPGQTRSG